MYWKIWRMSFKRKNEEKGKIIFAKTKLKRTENEASQVVENT